jgi:hypothetical protein
VRASRRPPTHIDETYEVPLPPQCPHCTGAIQAGTRDARGRERISGRSCGRCWRQSASSC